MPARRLRSADFRAYRRMRGGLTPPTPVAARDSGHGQWRAPESELQEDIMSRYITEAAMLASGGYREPYSRGGLMRWDLPGARYVLGDSSIGEVGCCIRDADTYYVLVRGA